jgi:hypothetical protein
MTTLRKLLTISALLLFTAAFASADNFNFTFTGQENTVSGTFVTTPEGGGQFLITDILNGMVDGNPITSVLPPDTYEFNDNILFFPPTPNFSTVMASPLRTRTASNTTSTSSSFITC